METISIIGIGKLGICFALSLEKAGYHVHGVDISESYVKSISNNTFVSLEPQVNEYLQQATKFTVSTSIEDAVNFSDTIFILVATPTLSKSSRYDHSVIDKIVDKLLSIQKPKNIKQLIIGCTVMPGYTDSIALKLKDYNYEVSYNPEFIAQGSIIKNQLEPDMVLIGEASNNAGDIIEQIYKKLCINNPVYNRMSPLNAEITKIALNCFLTTKISYANMIGDIAVKSGCDPDLILKAIGSDSRIGNKYLRYGFGFGGPCFSRDNRALYTYSDDINYDAKISKITDVANNYHLNFQVNAYIEKNTDKSIPIIINDITYKKDSYLIEESQQLLFAVKLAEAGYDVTLENNKVVLTQVKAIYGNLFKYKEI